MARHAIILTCALVMFLECGYSALNDYILSVTRSRDGDDYSVCTEGIRVERKCSPGYTILTSSENCASDIFIRNSSKLLAI